MLSTSARLLRLASLLQARAHWSGAALAEALQVEPRTVRRDMERLRELGYPVAASAGVGGGYALGRGAALPPLVLDDEEAVTLAMALRVATTMVGGIETTALRLLSKLDQLLPTRLRRRAALLHAVTLSVRVGAPLVEADQLTQLATACRDAISLSFEYRTHAGETRLQQVQPARIAHYGRRWYLIGWDLERADWRTFRVDRMTTPPGTGARFAARSVPTDVLTRLERGIAMAPYACHISVRVAGTLEVLRAELPVWCGVLEADPHLPRHCLLHISADTPEAVLAHLLMVGRECTLVDSGTHAPALQQALQRMLAMFAGSASKTSAHAGPLGQAARAG